MSELFARYSLREKAIIALALLVIVVIGAHALVVEPYLERVAALQDEIEQQREDLKWMRSAVTRIPAADAAAAASADPISGTLANFIDQAVRRQGLTGQLSQMSPVGDDEIRMRFSDVDFNRLVGFIAQVNSSGLDVKDIRISPADTPGIADSSLVLVRR
jgi:type II secretory pathway component PulM